MTKEPIRQSLETVEKPRAELICKSVDLARELRCIEERGIVLPRKLTAALGLVTNESANGNYEANGSILVPAEDDSPLIEEVLSEHNAYIEVENSKHHAANKKRYLARFFGSAALGLRGDDEGVFTGRTLKDVKVGQVRATIDALPVGKKTKKHHREAFHSLFEFALKYNFYVATNFRYPNPMSALPSYHEKNLRIVFLTKPEVDHLMDILTPYPSIKVAVALMIYAGLRRAEALWMTKDCVAPDLKFLSVINKLDGEKDIESRLKTGQRGVPVISPLKPILEPYLETLKGDWLVPSPTGLQWIGENFGDRHRAILRAENLRHTCLHYRHSFATDRAREGWSLFRISKAMGNSVVVCEQYYAAFVDPDVA